MRVERLSAVLCGLIVIGCAAPETVRERLYAMGTWVDVAFESPDSATAAAALSDLERLLRAFERDYYPWTPGALADLNTAIASGRAALVEPGLMALLTRARGLSAASDGFFDPGVGALVELWGFDSTLAGEREPPSDAAIAATLAAGGGIAALELDAKRAHSSSRGLVLDLGGIAKGAAVERAVRVLEAHAIANGLINAGGDLAVIGNGPGGRPWRVGVRDPRGPGTLGTIELDPGEAAFTSGDYERFYERDGRRLHHLLDPSTGRPVTHTQAVTVLSKDPVLADAAATAMFVAGSERWRDIGERMGISTALRVGADGKIEMTPSMATRLQRTAPMHAMIAGSSEE